MWMLGTYFMKMLGILLSEILTNQMQHGPDLIICLPKFRAAEYIFVPGTTNFGDLSCPLKNNQIIPFLPYE